MLFLVDGYNVTMGDDATRRLSREGQRDALVARLATRGPELLGEGGIVVVFDGQHGHGVRGSAGVIDVRFSRSDTADDVIVRIAEQESGSVCVITSDRGLKERVRAVAGSRAAFKGSSALFERCKTRKRGRGRIAASSVGMPKGANKITQELKSIWLTDKEDG